MNWEGFGVKRLLAMVLSLTGLALAGCVSLEKPAPDAETQSVEVVAIAPFGNGVFVDGGAERPEPVKDLPEGYGYIGDLGEDEALDSGLAGCRMYADLAFEPSECSDVYVCQPVGESGGEWAYVKYVRLLYGEAGI